MPDPSSDPYSPSPMVAGHRRSGCVGRGLGAVALFIMLAGAAGWLAWHGGMPSWFPHLPRSVTSSAAPSGTSPALPPATIAPVQSDAALSVRVAALESRLDAIDREASASAGNSARAEALLTAFAVRRAVDRGAQLGYLEDQLKLRFGDALPNSVDLVIAAAKNPMTLDQLVTRLDALAPTLSAPPPTESGWDRVKRDLSGLFVLRRDAGPAAPNAAQRLDHTRASLREGRISDAVGDVATMPAARDPQGPAQAWIAAARHYDEVQHALDLLETTALMEPRELKDGAGRKLGVPETAPTAP